MLDHILGHLPSSDRRHLRSTCQTLRHIVLASFHSLRVDRKPASPAERAFVLTLSGVRHLAAYGITLLGLKTFLGLPNLVSLSLRNIAGARFGPTPFAARLTALHLLNVSGRIDISALSALQSLRLEACVTPRLGELVHLQCLHLTTAPYGADLAPLTRLSFVSVATPTPAHAQWHDREDARALRALGHLPALRVLDYGQPAYLLNIPDLASLSRLTALQISWILLDGVYQHSELQIDLSALPELKRLGIEIRLAEDLCAVQAPTVTCLLLHYETAIAFGGPVMEDVLRLPDLTGLAELQHMMLRMDTSRYLIFEAARLPPQAVCLSVQHEHGRLFLETDMSMPSRIKYQAVSEVSFMADPETLVPL